MELSEISDGSGELNHIMLTIRMPKMANPRRISSVAMRSCDWVGDKRWLIVAQIIIIDSLCYGVLEKTIIELV